MCFLSTILRSTENMEKVKITLKSSPREMCSANNLINLLGVSFRLTRHQQVHRWAAHILSPTSIKIIQANIIIIRDFPGGASGKEPACQCRLIPGSGRSPGGGHGNPLRYSCLSYDRGGWGVHRVTQSQTRLMIHANIFPWLCMYISNTKVA